MNNNTFDVGDGGVPAAWTPALGQQRVEQGDLFIFSSRYARHVLLEEGTRSYLTLPTISHPLLNVSSLQQHFLDNQLERKFATFIYIRPRFATSCSTFPKLTRAPAPGACALARGNAL